MEGKKRLLSVIVFGILLILLPVFYWLQGVMIFLAEGISLKLLPKYIMQNYLSNFVVPLLHAISVICGIGILKLKEWARKLTTYIALTLLTLGIGILALAFPYPLLFKIQLIAISGLSYWFLTRPNVKEQFK